MSVVLFFIFGVFGWVKSAEVFLIKLKLYKMIKPDYKKIYSDLLRKKYPHKVEECTILLNKDDLSILDIINLNKKISGNQDMEITKENQKHRSYNKEAILQILEYQSKNRLNNSQLANHFHLSRNTVAKWKKNISNNAFKN
jgi:DNA-binding transcriptional regulator YiaG